MDRVLRPAILILLALVCAIGAAPAARAVACTSSQKASAKASLTAYTKQMAARRSAYFRAHRSAKGRAAFVSAQQKTVARLRAAAACDDSAPSDVPLPAPVPAPAPTANEHLNFSDEVAQSARDELQGDLAYAVQDEQDLLGTQLVEINLFFSTKPDWLAQQACGFYGYVGNCVAQKTSEFATGAAEGGPRAVFIDWGTGSGQPSASETQKTLAHELFHALQYQLDGLVTDGSTPLDQVRKAGPVWLHEGAAEVAGYHVLGDRHLGYSTYANLLANEKAQAKGYSAPLDQLLTVADDRNAGNPYQVYMVAVDHLVSEAAGGLHSLTAYYTALGAGAAWPDAFQQAFGMSVSAFYADFASYRAKL